GQDIPPSHSTTPHRSSQVFVRVQAWRHRPPLSIAAWQIRPCLHTVNVSIRLSRSGGTHMPLRFPLARVLLILVLGAVASVSTGCASDRAVIAQAQQFHGNLDAAIIKDPVLAGYIQRVGDRIISAAQEMHRQGYGPDRHKAEDSAWMFSGGMQFHLVNSETVNAFTTGGNHMYIYTGLMQQSATEDELAAVMAHEFAHVYGRHVHKGMDRQYGALATALGLGAIGYAVGDEDNRMTYAGAGAALGYLGTNLWNTSLGREDEEEADKLGFEFYIRA